MIKIIYLTATIIIYVGIILIFKKIISKQKIEIENLTCICDSTKTFRHDFNNIMQAIGRLHSN